MAARPGVGSHEGPAGSPGIGILPEAIQRALCVTVAHETPDGGVALRVSGDGQGGAGVPSHRRFHPVPASEGRAGGPDAVVCPQVTVVRATVGRLRQGGPRPTVCFPQQCSITFRSPSSLFPCPPSLPPPPASPSGSGLACSRRVASRGKLLLKSRRLLP